MSHDRDVAGTPDSTALANLRGLRLGRCARRILLLAARSTEVPSVIPPERAGRAAAESHRRAMRRLAGAGPVELFWKMETVQTARRRQTRSVVWDPAAGLYREVGSHHRPVERSIERRAVRLTALGGLLVDLLRPDLETGKRIRWTLLTELESE